MSRIRDTRQPGQRTVPPRPPHPGRVFFAASCRPAGRTGRAVELDPGAARGEPREAVRRWRQLEAQIQKLDQEQARIQGELRRPANAAVLDRSVFLNLLLQRKGISWTRLFADLEGVFPGGVEAGDHPPLRHGGRTGFSWT
ncbi:MAG: hypothetical protein MZV70_19325 [Desulfobacterales bacterium]|nr:hypothetical protein [Desulfobacterales bacterium]